MTGQSQSSQSDIEPSESASNVSQHPAKRAKTSDAYNHTSVTQLKRDDKGKVYEMRKCNYCDSTFSFKDSTSGALRHLNEHHSKHMKANTNTDSSVVEPMDKYAKTKILQKPYSETNFREAVVKMIIMEDLPFCFADSPYFRALLSMLKPGISIIGKTTVRNDIDKMFDSYKVKIKAKLAGVTSKISLTGDAWTSKHNLSFLGVTGHYIDENWCLQKFLLCFEAIQGEHSGENLANVLLKCLTDFNLQSKTLCITTDNASNNDTMIATLEEKLGEVEDNIFTLSWCHVRCLAHVINIVCQDVLKGLKALDRKNIDRFLEDDNNFCESSFSVLAIDKISIMIRKIRRSPRQFEKFKQACVLKGLKPLMPIIDVSTWWNSTYDMLFRSTTYREALKLHALNEGWNSLILTEQDWKSIQFLVEVLKPFKEATKLASVSSVSISLNNSVSICEFLISSLKESVEKCKVSLPGLASSIEIVALKLQSYYNKNSVVANLSGVLDPRKKLSFFENAWASNPEDVEGLKEQFSDAFLHYKGSLPTAPVEEKPDNEDSAYVNFLKRQVGDQQGSTVDEMTACLNSPTVDFKIDPLDWWRTNSSSFPVLAKIARDYLGGMATSVPAEKVFSGGVDLITSNRMSLDSDSVTKVMTLKNWYRKW